MEKEKNKWNMREKEQGWQRKKLTQKTHPKKKHLKKKVLLFFFVFFPQKSPFHQVFLLHLPQTNEFFVNFKEIYVNFLFKVHIYYPSHQSLFCN